MFCIRKCISADIRHIFMGLLEGNLVEKRRPCLAVVKAMFSCCKSHA